MNSRSLSSLLFSAAAVIFSCSEPSSSPPPAPPQLVAPPDSVNALHAGASGRLYAASIKGLFISSDDGTTWFSGGAPVSGRDIGSALETPDGTIFAGSGGCGQPVGILRSTDRGASWSEMDKGLAKFCVGSLAFAPPEALFACIATEGIYRSTDAGAHWTPVNRGMTSASVWCVAPLADGSLLAGTIRGMFRSSTNGDRWSRIPQDSASVVYSVAQTSDGSLLASTERGLRHSTDFGATWNPVNTGLIGEAVFQIAAGRNGEAYVAGQEAVARSTDNGGSWSACGAIPPTWISSVAVAKDGTLFTGTYAGIYRSTNGGASWTLLR